MGIEKNESSFFRTLSSEWWNESGSLRALHSMHPVRMSFMNHNYGSMDNSYILDIGCGAGITSESCARLGAMVTGIDIVAESVEIAKKRSTENGLGIKYFATSLFDFEHKDDRYFDVIVMFEVLEHVEDYSAFLNYALKLLKPNGMLFLSTINKTLHSFIKAIVLAEYVFHLAKRGTHHWSYFIPHQDLCNILLPYGQIISIKGLRYNPILNRWSIVNNSLDTNYILAFRKNNA
jgi:2-polyprenyl-6-hydroxyphenyl methylase/3-demethylubiquinone-9 3-methyltransferase